MFFRIRARNSKYGKEMPIVTRKLIRNLEAGMLFHEIIPNF